MLEVRSNKRNKILYNIKLFFIAGVIDEDYRGKLTVVLFNHSDENFIIKRGDRIAQLICEKIIYPEIEEVEVIVIFFFININSIIPFAFYRKFLLPNVEKEHLDQLACSK